MARVVNEEENAAKRKQILDVFQGLIYTKGYESLTIQDVLAGVQMSKGAFYHYYDSKQALLGALIDRMMDDVEKLLTDIAYDPDLPALDKLNRYFSQTAVWKTERKAILGPIMRVWYSDENTVVRHRLIKHAIVRLGGLFAHIVRQGVREGVMDTPYPEEIVQFIYSSTENMGESMVALLLAPEPMPDRVERLEHTFGFYADALERLVGAPHGSLPLVDMDLIKQWILEPEPARAPVEPMAAD